MPFFSVIIPLYNKEKYIAKCLESALVQTFLNYEIIIVNDGSTDSSVSIAQNFKSEKIVFLHQENLGASAARNNGATLARGVYLAFLDADDYWRPNHLAKLRESIECFPKAGLYGNNYDINHNGIYTKPARFNFSYSKAPLILSDFFEASLYDTVIWTSASAIKRENFFNYGMFNPIYLSSQDLDLWIRIALKEPIVFNPESTMIYDKSIEDSLGKYEDNDARYILFNSFSEYESDNYYLKKYLDIKRYGLALRTKINGESKIYNDTLKTINFENLTFKQKTLLKTPAFILKVLNKIRPYIITSKFYLKVFKR